MPPAQHPEPVAADLTSDVNASLSSVNAVFTLSLILTQASSPSQLIRLVTTAIPSITRCEQVLAWHPSRPGDYYEQAPEAARATLASVREPRQLHVSGLGSCWVFPLAAGSSFLIIVGGDALSEQDVFLLSVLAQLCGTVIAKLELIAAEQASSQRVAALNTELETTVSTLAKIMQTHRRLNEIAAGRGEAGIAQTLRELTGFPVLIQDEQGRIRAAAGDLPEEPGDQAAPRDELIVRLRQAHRAVYHRGAWLALASPRPGALGVIALIDPGRAAGETDLAALEYAATVLSVELARLHSLADAELRGQADRERDIARARAAELAASEARQRAILEAALDAVVSIDQHARITYVNSAFERTFGYRAEDVIGQELGAMIVPPSLLEKHRAGFARHLATGQRTILDRRLEATAMRADGSLFPAELTVTRTGLDGEPAFTGYIRDITDRRRAEQELAAARTRMIAASDATRQRVVRDLHDGAQQRLVTTLINLQLAEQKWESQPERARELVGLALRDAKLSIDDLREIAAGIRPAILTSRGLAAAIDALAARLPIPVELDVASGRLPAPIEANVYYFCAEALTNVIKHARATSAWVRLTIDAGRCAIEIRDDGIGGAQLQPEAGGLTGLLDRILVLDGTMDIDSPANGGTVLAASVPLPAEPAASPDPVTLKKPVTLKNPVTLKKPVMPENPLIPEGESL
jgi:PAS domain S-box-containing protein